MTGKQQAGQYLVWVLGAEVWLTAALFRVMCQLVAARLRLADDTADHSLRAVLLTNTLDQALAHELLARRSLEH